MHGDGSCDFVFAVFEYHLFRALNVDLEQVNALNVVQVIKTARLHFGSLDQLSGAFQAHEVEQGRPADREERG